MKTLLKYTLTVLISLYASQATVLGCGPEGYVVPSPSYFHVKITDIGNERERVNLLLWQSQTSKYISIEDIRDVIYGKALPKRWCAWWCYDIYENGIMEWNNQYDEGNSQNGFVNYLNNAQDTEAYNFIMLAKHLADLRADRNSPWYYPESKYELDTGFDGVIKTIEAYQSKRFFNRYSLQLIRALFASRRYEECIEAYNDRFGNVADNDLMKQMARDYIAGAAARIGKEDLSIDYFAAEGDVESLSRFLLPEAEAFELAAIRAPNSVKLLKFIKQKINGEYEERLNPTERDSIFVKTILIPIAYKVLSNKKADKALWHYILAVCEGEYNGNSDKAYSHIKKAWNLRNNSDYADNIRAYRFAVESKIGNSSNLLGDLLWIESKVADVTSPDNYYWVKIMQNIIFTKLAPACHKRGDLMTALQLANYADNMPLKYSSSAWRFASNYMWRTNDIHKARREPNEWNSHDYSNTFFQFMEMQRPEDIERYIALLSSDNPLAKYLNSRGYTSRDYLYDLLGTQYIRRRDYANAVKALSQVSPKYQTLLNVDRDGYLRRDPFGEFSDYQIKDWYNRGFTYKAGLFQKNNNTTSQKLDFAKEMCRLEYLIAHEKDPNKRGQARIKYAVGLSNSFDNCWALTSYSQGFCFMAFLNELTDSKGQNGTTNPIYYEEYVLQATKDAQTMISQGLAELTDPEIAAIENYRLYNYITIAKCYPNTKIGRIMASKCDTWSDYIK